MSEGVRTLVGEITFEGLDAVDEESLRDLIQSEELVPYRELAAVTLTGSMKSENG